MSTKAPFAADKETLCTIMEGTMQGVWTGEGMDVFPTPQGVMKTPYTETMTFGDMFTTLNPGGPTTSQTLVGIHYITKLDNAKTGEPMHQETGYWLFDVERGRYIKAVSIPRGITILAGGGYIADINLGLTMMASAELGSPTFGISNDQFLNQMSPTTRFGTTIQVQGNTLGYTEDSVLTIQGESMNHTDTATLNKQ